MRKRLPRPGRLALVGLVGVVVAGAVAAVSVAASPPYKNLKGSISADGSSTVGPYTTAAAELFKKVAPKVRITVGISGTGGGFQRFCNGETDLSDASRPISFKSSSEVPNCIKNGIKYAAFTVANDGISLVVNKQNTWANCLTVSELKKIWEPGSKVDNWKDIRPSFPDESLKLYGAGTDSGTFDFFTEAINGKAKSSRTDYTATEDDNVTVRGVEGDKGALGYFGYSYFAENQGKLKLLAVDNQKGAGCIKPSPKTVQNRAYRPLSRPLFIYAKRASFVRSEVEGFIGFIFANEKLIAKRARLISLTDKQLRKARYQYKQAVKQIKG